MMMVVVVAVVVAMVAHPVMLAAPADAMVRHRGRAGGDRFSLGFVNLCESGGGKAQSKASGGHQKNAGARSNRHGNSPLDKTAG